MLFSFSAEFHIQHALTSKGAALIDVKRRSGQAPMVHNNVAWKECRGRSESSGKEATMTTQLEATGVDNPLNNEECRQIQ